jgi:YidC/Oxa1 family membrane protein insertase
LIGLYQAIITVLGTTPQALFELVPRTYPAINLSKLIPVDNMFLWMNLSQPDPFFILPILVFASMFVQQKLLTPTSSKNQNAQDNPMAGMTQSMQYTMPLMFGFFSLQFPSGLSIYFILANLIGIAQGLYMKRITDREKAERAAQGLPAAVAVETGDSAPAKASSSANKSKQSANGNEGGKSKSTSPQTATKRKKRSAKR